ncbi:MAG TPA: amidohydrolase family protein [Candidatus Angelobacter sp.]
MRHLRKHLAACLFLLVLAVCVSGVAQDSYALKGTLVTPTQVIENGTVLVVGQKIKAVGSNVSLPAGTKVIETGGFIYPGLIDLHNHLTWNLLPRWKPGQLFSNRYEWQQSQMYKLMLTTPEAKVIDAGLDCDANRYGEVKAIVGGATSVTGSLNPRTDPRKRKCLGGMARNLDFFSGFYSDDTAEKVRYEIFPLQLSFSDAATIRDQLSKHELSALIVHLSEGKQGDASAAREYLMFKARGFLVAGTSIIHGVALHQAEFQEMQKAGVGLIWSPRSNFELYGETTDVAAAKQANLKIAIAPDWSPSGSDGMLQELKYASTWNEGQRPKPFQDSDLVQMATINAATLAGLSDKIGSLAPDHFADLLVLKKKNDKSDAFRSLLQANVTDVELVVIGGIPAYGNPDIIRKIVPGVQLDLISLCGISKGINFESERIAQGVAPKPWKQTAGALTEVLGNWGLSLSPLAECIQ